MTIILSTFYDIIYSPIASPRQTVALHILVLNFDNNIAMPDTS